MSEAVDHESGGTAAEKDARARRRFRFAFVAVICIALSLRLWSVDFGAPAATARPDEAIILREAVLLVEGSRHVHFFNYPSALFFLTAAWLELLIACRILDSDPLAAWMHDPMPFHIAVRVLSAIFGTATAAIVGWAARRRFGRAAGIFAAAFLGFSPLHVLHSHFGTLDVPAVFFATCAWAALLAKERRNTPINVLVTAAFLAGVAAGVKYPCGVVVLPVLLAALDDRSRLRRLLVVAIACGAGFLVAAPTFLTQTNDALAGIFNEFRVQDLERGNWVGPHRIVYYLDRALFGKNEIPAVLAFVGILVAIMRRRRHDLALASAAAIVVFVQGGVGRVFLRYMLPVLPMIAFFAASLLDRKLHPRLRAVVVVSAVLGLLRAAVATVDLDLALGRSDTRGEMIVAREDGRLPRGVPIFLPFGVCEIFPAGSFELTGDAKLSSRADAGCVPILDRAENRLSLLEPKKNGLGRVYRVDAGNIWATAEKAGNDFLLIVPRAFGFGRQSTWNLDLVERPEKRVGWTVEKVLSLDPLGGREFEPRTSYDPYDFFFTPFDRPRIAERPGPKIDVWRFRKS